MINFDSIVVMLICNNNNSEVKYTESESLNVLALCFVLQLLQCMQKKKLQTGKREP